VVDDDGTQATNGTGGSGSTGPLATGGGTRAADAETEQPALLELSVAHEHVAGLTKTKKPIIAVEELVWNGLDADAKNVAITLVPNRMEGLDRIIIEDDGDGMDPAAKEESFGKLGGSLKRTKPKTQGGRTMHGKEGKGRFRAFALGARVEWVSRYKQNGVVNQWSIAGDITNLRRFPHTKPRPADEPATGTIVTVTDVSAPLGALSSERAQKELLMRLAPYLRNYPEVKVTFEGKPLDVAAVEESSADYDLQVVTKDGQPLPATLRIIEWKMEVERKIFLCTGDGFARHEEPIGIQAPGFNFTAYVMAPEVGEMSDAELSLSELEPRVRALTEAARDKLREHFRAWEKDQLRAIVEQWKAEGIYPYETEVTSPVAQVERNVFDILAIKVHERLPGFEKNTTEGKSFTFKLLRQAIESNPSSLQTILQEVLKLPKQQQDDFAALLQKTKLSGIIKAARVVSDRLTFLAGLKQLLFDPFYKKHLKERSQLQRILVNELWVFGEQYLLGTDDQGLKKVLTAHAKILGRQELAPDVDVKDINDEQAIPDLMLYRRFGDRRMGEYEHLVIELKRPSTKGGGDEISQIRNYAHTVQDDARFDKGKTRWTFVLVVNELDKLGEAECRPQSGRKYGHIGAFDNLDIYVMKWSSIIQDCEWRHEFYRKELDLEVQEEDARQYVEKKYAEYLPPADGTSAAKPPEANAASASAPPAKAKAKAKPARGR
jgi:hypothetical protein